ncbi:MAG: CBS and ACT domain-containing protein [Anaerolineales bacterium]
MLVKDRMTSNPMVIGPDASHPEALRMLHKEKFSYLPVVNKSGKLVGIVTETDLLHAAPSSATSLSIYEMNYLLSNLKVHEVMSSPVITIPEDTPIEEAARLMIEKSIGCLPVMRGNQLVGVITETDIFKTFVEILGQGTGVLRITLRSPDQPGELARLTGVIAKLGGNIHAVASFHSEDLQHVFFTFRIDGVEEDVLIPALKEMGEQVIRVVHIS